MAPFWEDPRSLAIGRRRSHTPLRSYKSSQLAVEHLAQPPEQHQYPCPLQAREQLLSGCSWKFKLFQNPDSVPEDFFRPEYDDSGFGTVSTGASLFTVACDALSQVMQAHGVSGPTSQEHAAAFACASICLCKNYLLEYSCNTAIAPEALFPVFSPFHPNLPVCFSTLYFMH